MLFCYETFSKSSLTGFWLNKKDSSLQCFNDSEMFQCCGTSCFNVSTQASVPNNKTSSVVLFICFETYFQCWMNAGLMLTRMLSETLGDLSKNNLNIYFAKQNIYSMLLWTSFQLICDLFTLTFSLTSTIYSINVLARLPWFTSCKANHVIKEELECYENDTESCRRAKPWGVVQKSWDWLFEY